MSRKKRYTHTATMLGADKRTQPDFKKTIHLRELQRHWVSPTNLKFNKDSGRGTGDWPMFRIELDSLEGLDSPVKL